MKRSLVLFLIYISVFLSFLMMGKETLLAEEPQKWFDKEAFIASLDEKRVLKLSMSNCVHLALKNNSEIRIKRIEPIIADFNIKKAKGKFEPTLDAYYEYDETKTPSAYPALAGSDVSRSREIDINAGLSGKLFFTNTQYDIDFKNEKSKSNSSLQQFLPAYTTNMSATLTQPVLKDFVGMAQDQANIVIARNNKVKSKTQLKKEMIKVISDVKTAYHNYLLYNDQYRVAQTSLERARGLQRITQERYENGLVSSVDVLEAQAGVAKREQALLYFEGLFRKAEDELKLVTNLIDDSELWNAEITVTDRPGLEAVSLDLAESIKESFENRPDYESAKIDLKNKDINVKMAHNELWPSVDVVGTLDLNGLTDKYVRSFDQTKRGEYASWSVGVQVTVPFGYTEELSNYDIKKLEKKKAIIAFSRLEQRIILEVRDGLRKVDINFRNVEATKKSLEAEENKYYAAKERFKSGLVSTHDMLEFQEDFDLAKLSHLEAIIDYSKALTNLGQVKGVTLVKNNIVLED